MAYLDDVIFAVPPHVAADALAILREELEEVGHYSSVAKLQLWSPQGHCPQGLSPAAQERWSGEGIAILGHSIGSNCIDSADPADLMEEGIAVGSDHFERTALARKVEGARKLGYLALQTLADGEPGEPHAQVVGLIMRISISAKVSHLLRGQFVRPYTDMAS